MTEIQNPNEVTKLIERLPPIIIHVHCELSAKVVACWSIRAVISVRYDVTEHFKIHIT